MILPRDRGATAARETRLGNLQAAPARTVTTGGAAAGGAATASDVPAGEPAPQARRLFDSLPYAYRLMTTRQRFPHVLERIAAEWESPARLLHLFDELMIDRRGNREGFPFETMIEIANLRDYYVHEVRPGLRSVSPFRPGGKSFGTRRR